MHKTVYLKIMNHGILTTMAGNYNKQEKLWDIVGWYMKHNTISEKIISNWRVYYRQHSITRRGRVRV